MHFDLTPDQRELKETIRDFAQREVAPRAEELDRNAVLRKDGHSPRPDRGDWAGLRAGPGAR